jgi:hypothetical protein
MSLKVNRKIWKILRIDDLDRGGGIDLSEDHSVQSIALRPRKQMSELEGIKDMGRDSKITSERYKSRNRRARIG